MKFRILFTAALFALAAGPAHAGPIAAAVAWVGGVLAAGGAAAAIMQMALGLALNMVVTAVAKAMQKAPEVSVKFEVELGDDTPLKFSLGTYATAGKRRYVGSWGWNTRFVTMVVECSSLPQGLSGVWVGDDRGEFAPGINGYIRGAQAPRDTGAIWENPANPAGFIQIGASMNNHIDDTDSGQRRMWLKWVDGTQAAADPFLMWAFGLDPDYPWTSAMVGKGKAYAIITCQYDHESMLQYPEFLFELEPLPLYDPRLDSTAGGLGAHRWGDRSSYAPSDNLAVMAYNVARGIYYGDEWLFGGQNLDAWRLPFDEWVAAMNACDQQIELADGSFERAFRGGAEISVEMEPLGVMEELGRAANMRFAEVGGRLKPICGLPGASVFSITDEDIIITEGQSYQPFLGLSATYNALTATYPEPGEKWASKDAPEFIDTVATAADDGRYLPVGVSYPAAPHANQVQRLMRAQLQDYRRMRVHQLSLPPDAYGLEPLVDMISWTSARNGYDAKRFLVMSVAKMPGMNVAVTLREVDPADYDWQPGFELPYTIVPPVNVLPFVQRIASFSAAGAVLEDSSGRGRKAAIVVGCGGDEAGVTQIRIQILKGAEAVFDVSRPYGAPYSWTISDVTPDTAYTVRACLISELTGKTEWSPDILVTTPSIEITDADLDPALRDSISELIGFGEALTGPDGIQATLITAKNEALAAEAGAAANAAAALATQGEVEAAVAVAEAAALASQVSASASGASRDAALAAQGEVAAAVAVAEAAALASQVSASTSGASRDAALAAQGEVEAAVAVAEAAALASQTSASTSGASRDAAQAARTAAETARNQAQTSATNAGNSASAAAGSASTASTRATEAGQSASAAAASAVTAGTKATEAGTAAQAAALSESSAATFAGEAEDSASAAASSAVTANTKAGEAAGSAGAAATSAATATTKATEAGTSATAANSAKTAAETARGQAQTAATNAATSETNAAGSANSAASSATTSASSRDAAAGSATAAAGAASLASTKATEAGNSATAANSAKTAAETARGQAQAAASSAATSEINAAGSANTASTQATAAAKSFLNTVMVEGNPGFDDGYAGWRHGLTPTAADLSAVHGDLSAGQFISKISVRTDMGQRKFHRILPGRKYRMRARFTISGAACQVYLGYQAGNDAGSLVGTNQGLNYVLSAGAVYPVSTTPVEVTSVVFDLNYVKTTSFGASPDAAGVYAIAMLNYGNVANARVALDGIWLEDVTESEATKADASASATSAALASTKATEAGTSATAAQTARTAAETARGQAQTAATNAATSETNAAGSANAAATSATTSASSRDAAAGSATAAAGSASTASTRATEAGQAASAAAASAVTAGTKATEAGTAAQAAALSESSAATFAGEAEDSASAAASSALTANTKAGEAAGSAGAAATSAATATTKATEAGTSATAANSAKTAAETARGQAQTAATNAATSETNAAGSANSAASSATTSASSRDAAAGSATAAAGSASLASTKATEAGNSATAANSAKTAAETARGQAQAAVSSAATSETNAAGSANSAASSATVSASTLSTLQMALASTTAIVAGKASPATLPYGASNTGLPATYSALPVSAYGSDADGAFCKHLVPGSGSAVLLRALVPCASDKVYRVTIKVKCNIEASLSIVTYWLNASGAQVNGQGLFAQIAVADGMMTLTGIIGATVGGLVTVAAGTVANWSAAQFIRFGVMKGGNHAATTALQVYDINVEDLTQADKAARSANLAAGSANAASTSASTASAKATEAGTSAAAANTAKTAAETARGQAQTAATSAATSETNAAGSANSAASSATTSASSRDAAAGSATAAAGSASVASTKATEAGTSATAAQTARTGAETARSGAEAARTTATTAADTATGAAATATSQATLAATARTGAETARTGAEAAGAAAQAHASAASGSALSASESAAKSLTYATNAARLMSGGVSKNPIFNLWTGTYPDHVAVTPYAGNTVTKNTANARYQNALQVVCGGTADGPLIRIDQAGQALDCSKSPRGVKIRMEIEFLSGNLANSGALLRAIWLDSGTRTEYVNLKDYMTATTGVVQVVEVYFARPAAAVPASATNFILDLFASSLLGGTRAAWQFRVHRFDFEEVLANSETAIIQQAIADVTGIKASAIGLRATAGSAGAYLELVALEDPNGPASMARIAADLLLLEGTIRGDHMELKSLRAEHLDVPFLNGERIRAEFLDVDSLLTIQPGAGLRYQKATVNSDATDGLYFGHDGGRFGFAASRTSANKRQSLKLSQTTGLQLLNARHFVTGASLPQTAQHTASLSKTALPAGIKEISLEVQGAGGAGEGLEAVGAGSTTTTPRHTGGNGGSTIVRLYDGATLKQTITAAGGNGGGVTTPSPTQQEGKGKDSSYAPGGAMQTADKISALRAGYPGSRGSGASGAYRHYSVRTGGSEGNTTHYYVYGRGGAAGQLVTTEVIDLSGYAAPFIEIVIGNGGVPAAPTELGKGGRGGAGEVNYVYSVTMNLPADVVPLVPTAVGTFVPAASGSFPNRVLK